MLDYELAQSARSTLAEITWQVRSRTSAHYVGCYLTVGVSVVLVCSGVVILLDEAKILLSLPLEDQLPTFHVSWQVALKKKRQGKRETEREHEMGM